MEPINKDIKDGVMVDRNPINAPITDIVLMEDRAKVKRSFTGKLELGSGKLRIPDVSPVIVDKTLLVTVIEGGAKVDSSRVLRYQTFQEESGPVDLLALEKERLYLEKRIEELDELKNASSQALNDLENVARRIHREISEDVSWGKADQKAWEEHLNMLSKREEVLRLEILEIDFQLEDAKSEMRRLEERMDAAENPSSGKITEIHIDITVDDDSAITLEIIYTVPNACWRPAHQARMTLDGANPKLDFSCGARVWQNTGEDWNDVNINFSTKRLSLGLKPPVLDSDLLFLIPKRENIVVEARDEKIYKSGEAPVDSGQAVVPGINDGGETIHLSARLKRSVPSDGRPCQVPIFEFETSVDTELRLLPELAPAVLLAAEGCNMSEFPVLPGPVELIRDYGRVGKTVVEYVAPGAKFQLGWGPDGEIRVNRKAESFEEDKRIMSSWLTTVYRVDNHISNLSPKEKQIEMTERILVSEIEKVKVEFDKKESSEGAFPDENGFLKWSVKLKPFERKTISLKYQVQHHNSVVGV